MVEVNRHIFDVTRLIRWEHREIVGQVGKEIGRQVER